jgi:hypothetical protein
VSDPEEREDVVPGIVGVRALIDCILCAGVLLLVHVESGVVVASAASNDTKGSRGKVISITIGVGEGNR